MTTRTAAIEADLATIPGYPGAVTVVAVPPSDAAPAPFMMEVYIAGQVVGRVFDPMLAQP